MSRKQKAHLTLTRMEVDELVSALHLRALDWKESDVTKYADLFRAFLSLAEKSATAKSHLDTKPDWVDVYLDDILYPLDAESLEPVEQHSMGAECSDMAPHEQDVIRQDP
ncbi:hypothetical protein [Sulfobacillus thermosulfidooxidans]|uniref:hypothetical protein n=1 Tax=Sulfobacillus thermosulfidooxidans TaxID=28034 RepID=UPI000A9D5D9F|nr:hypothetical protein [Sulfobacillus thermosulfidooxidans]